MKAKTDPREGRETQVVERPEVKPIKVKPEVERTLQRIMRDRAEALRLLADH